MPAVRGRRAVRKSTSPSPATPPLTRPRRCWTAPSVATPSPRSPSHDARLRLLLRLQGRPLLQGDRRRGPLAPLVENRGGGRIVRDALGTRLRRPRRRAGRRENLRPPGPSSPPPAQRRLPAHLLSQRHPRPPGLLPTPLSRARAVTIRLRRRPRGRPPQEEVGRARHPRPRPRPRRRPGGRMTDGLPTSDQLLADPELAVLHALGAALAAAQRALAAAHPELEEDDFLGS